MHRLAATLARLPADPRPDGALLGAFARHRDEAALAEVVRRHARPVWAVCCRTLPDPLDAEDAFQATVLVLVRRAGSLAGAATVGPWLGRVAGLTARARRRQNARRLARVGPLPTTVPDPRPRPLDAELDAAAALRALPARERTAVALCCLHGLTHREAGDHLGCPEGTVSARVSRGLARLRTRLAGRDPRTALAVLAAPLVPAGLPAAAVRLSLSAASPTVLHLSRGVLRMFWVQKLVAAGMVLAAVAGAGVAVRQSAADGPPAPPPADRLAGVEQQLKDVQRQLADIQQRLGPPVQPTKLDPPPAPTKAGLLVMVGGPTTTLPPVTVSELRDGKPVWTTTFPGIGWDKPDWTPLRDFLARARRGADGRAGTGPQAVVVQAEAAPLDHIRAVVDAVRAAGFRPGEITAPTVAPTTRVGRPDPDVQPDERVLLTVAVGDTISVALSGRGDVWDVLIDRDDVAKVIVGAGGKEFVVSGLAPGTADVSLSTGSGAKHHLRVTVTAK